MKDMIDKLRNPDLGLLVIRLGLGTAFLLHGVQKLQGMDGVVGFFGSLGFPPFLAWLVALIETVGGLAMLLGLWVEAVGLLFAVIMVVAILKVKLAKGFLGGYELESMLLAMSLAMTFAGAGKYAVMKGAKKAAPAKPGMAGPGPEQG